MSQPNLADDDQGIVSDESQGAALASAPAPANVPTQKQKTDVYTVMLIVSFICIVIACILLFWELSMWGSYPWWNTQEGIPNVSQAVPTVAGGAGLLV